MPTDRERRRADTDRADADRVHRAATWLRSGSSRSSTAGLTHDHVAHALADLIDVLAGALPGLDSGVRWQLLDSVRVVLGEPMAVPELRRTRRR